MHRLLPVLALLLAVPALAQQTPPDGGHPEHDAYHSPFVGDLESLTLAMRIGVEHYECLERAIKPAAAMQCQRQTIARYEAGIQELVDELRPFMTPPQQVAFDAAHTTWEGYAAAQRAFLEAYWAEVDREWGEPMELDALVLLYRGRLEALDAMPRG